MDTILTVTGILLSTLGVVLIYYFGLSPFLKKHESGYVMIYSQEELQNKQSKENRRKRIYARLANIGLLLCVLGAYSKSLRLSKLSSHFLVKKIIKNMGKGIDNIHNPNFINCHSTNIPTIIINNPIIMSGNVTIFIPV
jgi:hypothetical protein